ncbi:hypothetical protein HDV02_004277 [Globomyces sp. JEL0801]|nr:hypothetical protein HDV02_004277 [Globomyces sp. JEL0801]
MRFTQRLFGSLIIILTYLFAPLKVVMTGHHQDLNNTSFAPIIANHQIYTDWWYIWIFAYFRNSHGELKIMMMEKLRSIPIFGWGMRCFEFIFLARVWKIDQDRIVNALQKSLNDKTPMWLLLFPEGTVICDETKERSMKYAKKIDISIHPKHVLLPKSTGLYHVLKNLKSKAEYLYDFTIGYSGLNSDQCPYDEYPPTKVFFLNQGPKSIHMHVNRYRISDIPGMNTKSYDRNESVPVEFELWLRKLFMEKDEAMKLFYQTASFPDVSEYDGTGLQQVLHISPDKQDWISITGLIVSSVMTWSWMFS